MPRFAAIDFETANYSADSACAIGMVIVDEGRIVHRAYHLIRPPTREFTFTHIHGLKWSDVHDEPTFDVLWPELQKRMGHVQFFAAHNAPFDRKVLRACCENFSLPLVRQPFVCTVQVAREVWDIRPTKLPDVCKHLDIPLVHHSADSDAEACAKILIAAHASGWIP